MKEKRREEFTPPEEHQHHRYTTYHKFETPSTVPFITRHKSQYGRRTSHARKEGRKRRTGRTLTKTEQSHRKLEHKLVGTNKPDPKKTTFSPGTYQGST